MEKMGPPNKTGSLTPYDKKGPSFPPEKGRAIFLCLWAGLWLWSGPAGLAGEAGEARALKDEAQAIMAAYQERKADHREYALALLKLERALRILEENGQGQTELANEIASSWFWAKRTSNLLVIQELDRLRTQGGYKIPSRFAPKKREEGAEGSEEAQEMEPEVLAMKALKEAKAFAAKHPQEPFLAAKRFFLAAGEHPGTIGGVQALGLAREALLRYANQDGPAAVEAGTAEAEVLARADKLAAKGNYPESFPIYRRAQSMKDGPEIRRRLGRAFFNHAQNMREEILAEWESALERFEEARRSAWVWQQKRRVFNPEHPAWVKAQQEKNALLRRAGTAKQFFDQARGEFEAVLRLSPDRKDLEASAYIALCARGREEKTLARALLASTAQQYQPADDYQRILHEYVKIELETLVGKEGKEKP